MLVMEPGQEEEHHLHERTNLTSHYELVTPGELSVDLAGLPICAQSRQYLAMLA